MLIINRSPARDKKKQQKTRNYIHMSFSIFAQFISTGGKQWEWLLSR